MSVTLITISVLFTWINSDGIAVLAYALLLSLSILYYHLNFYKLSQKNVGGVGNWDICRSRGTGQRWNRIIIGICGKTGNNEFRERDFLGI